MNRKLNDIRAAVLNCQCPQLECYFATVTPQLAATMLEHNTHNRKISTPVVNKYKNEIALGEWVPTSAGIGFDENGVLCDGQHRLAAIVEAGTPCVMLVSFNLPALAQEKIDRQRKRTLFDVLYLSGEANNRTAVQIATYMAQRVNRKSSELSDAEVKAFYNSNRTAIDAIAAFGNKKTLYSRIGCLSALVEYWTINAKQCDEFCQQLKTRANLALNSPALRLLKTLEDCSFASGNVGGSFQDWCYEKTLFACKAHHEKRHINQVLSLKQWGAK